MGVNDFECLWPFRGWVIVWAAILIFFWCVLPYSLLFLAPILLDASFFSLSRSTRAKQTTDLSARNRVINVEILGFGLTRFTISVRGNHS